MQKNIIISIILFICINCVAQLNTDSVLLDIEKKIYTASNDTLKATLILKKTQVYLHHHYNDSILLLEMDRLHWNLITDSNQIKDYLWNAALLNLLNKRYHRAYHYFENYQSINHYDTSTVSQFFKALILMNIDSEKLNSFLNENQILDSLFFNLKCYQSSIEYQKKGKSMYQVFSAIIPGSGMLALNKPQKGITSLLLNTGTAYTIYALFQNNLYFNAVTWGIVLTQKFYLGGIKLTGNLFDENENTYKYNNSSKCEEKVKQLLLKYPINYK